MISVEEAVQRILAGFAPLESERIALADADGRTLAADAQAKIDQPPFSLSAMDGYAVRSRDQGPRCSGRQRPGRPSLFGQAGSRRSGAAVHRQRGAGRRRRGPGAGRRPHRGQPGLFRQCSAAGTVYPRPGLRFSRRRGAGAGGKMPDAARSGPVGGGRCGGGRSPAQAADRLRRHRRRTVPSGRTPQAGRGGGFIRIRTERPDPALGWRAPRPGHHSRPGRGDRAPGR